MDQEQIHISSMQLTTKLNMNREHLAQSSFINNISDSRWKFFFFISQEKGQASRRNVDVTTRLAPRSNPYPDSQGTMVPYKLGPSTYNIISVAHTK